MALLLVLIFSAIIASGRCQDPPPTEQLEINVYEFSNCPDEEHMAISFDNISMKLDVKTKVLYVNGVMDMSIVWDSQIVLKYVLKKCQSKDTSSCIDVLNKVVDDVCGHLGEKNQPWTPLIEHLDHFKPECPVEPGKYEIDLAPVDVSSMKNMDSAQGIWHIQARGYLRDSPEKIVLCSDSAVEVKRKRRKKQKKEPVDTSAVDDV